MFFICTNVEIAQFFHGILSMTLAAALVSNVSCLLNDRYLFEVICFSKFALINIQYYTSSELVLSKTYGRISNPIRFCMILSISK